MIFQIVPILVYFASVSFSTASCCSQKVGFSLRRIFSQKHFSVFKNKNNKKNIFINNEYEYNQNHEKKNNTAISNKFILNSQKFISDDTSLHPSETTLIVHDVSNMLSIMKNKSNTAKFDLNTENNILKIIEKQSNIENLKQSIKQRVVVGSTISNTTSKGFIFQNKIFTTPGIQNPFWGIAAAGVASLTHIYPNLETNHVYLEYKKTILCKEEKVDYYGAKIAKENLHSVDTLLLLSGDGNAKEKYGFRHLCMDAISQNKKVIVFGLNTSKFYKQLAKQNKIILIDGDTEIKV